MGKLLCFVSELIVCFCLIDCIATQKQDVPSNPVGIPELEMTSTTDSLVSLAQNFPTSATSDDALLSRSNYYLGIMVIGVLLSLAQIVGAFLIARYAVKKQKSKRIRHHSALSIRSVASGDYATIGPPLPDRHPALPDALQQLNDNSTSRSDDVESGFHDEHYVAANSYISSMPNNAVLKTNKETRHGSLPASQQQTAEAIECTNDGLDGDDANSDEVFVDEFGYLKLDNHQMALLVDEHGYLRRSLVLKPPENKEKPNQNV